MSIFYPLQWFAGFVTNDLLAIPRENLFNEALVFFIADTLKIFILLFVIIFVISVLRSFVPPEKIRRILSRKNKFVGNVLAALFGILTPFCTCSAIPLFMGFLEAGVPVGVTFSFLVSSPMINEVALVLLLAMFGWKVALIYIFSGLVIAILAGIVIDKLGLENLVEKFAVDKSEGQDLIKFAWEKRLRIAKNYTFSVVGKVWPYVLAGVGFGALIHGYVPTDFLANYAGSDKWYGVLVATLIGIPLYSNVAGIIPLVGVLTEKGVSMGTTLAFMMAVTGLSLPEFMILKRVMKVKLIVIFASVVGAGILFTGYLFNWVLG